MNIWTENIKHKQGLKPCVHDRNRFSMTSILLQYSVRSRNHRKVSQFFGTENSTTKINLNTLTMRKQLKYLFIDLEKREIE